MITKLSDAIKEAKSIVFFTGAGMSTASGIPDFRSSSGLYNKYETSISPEVILSHTYFINHTSDFYKFYKSKMIYENAKPNSGHLYISELEKTKDVSVVTQNIDGLHQAAGSKKVYELHGSIHRNYCMKCHKFHPLSDVINSKDIPICDCGGIIKPDVVLYEEGLDENTINHTISSIYNADLLIILGTSLNVYPAASFIQYFRGKHLAIINKEPTPKDSMCDIVIHDDINYVFDELRKMNQ